MYVDNCMNCIALHEEFLTWPQGPQRKTETKCKSRYHMRAYKADFLHDIVFAEHHLDHTRK